MLFVRKLRPVDSIFWKRAARLFSAGLGLFLLILAGSWIAYRHRPQPAPVRETLFQGVTYIREVTAAPRPLVLHIIEVDITAPGIGFVVTPGDPNAPRPLRASKTSHFLQRFHAQVAVNGDYFFPFHSNGPLDIVAWRLGRSGSGWRRFRNAGSRGAGRHAASAKFRD